MKNAMKKIMSLMLVAMLLVSVFPMSAAAAGGSVSVVIDGVTHTTPISGTTTTAWNAIKFCPTLGDAKANEIKAALDAGTMTASVTGATLATTHALHTELPDGAVFTLTTVTTPAPTPTPTPAPTVAEPVKLTFCTEESKDVWGPYDWTLSGDKTTAESLLYYAQKNECLDKGYVFGTNGDGASVWVKKAGASKGSYIGTTDDIVGGDTVRIVVRQKVATPGSSDTSANGSTSGGSTSNKFPYKVYLHIYLNNTIDEPHKNVNITTSLAKDGVVSLCEVQTLVKDYYKAKDSDGIGYDGLYMAKGNWVKDFVLDENKYSKVSELDVRTGEEYVHINVMITNATVKNASTADSSNPKTGDTIFTAVTVMGLSASALAVAFFLNKKRAIV